MKRFLNLDLHSLAGAKDLSSLYPAETHKIHVDLIQTEAMQEIERNLEEDEDLQKEDLI